MSNDRVVEKHESFGLIGFTRTSGSARTLFGSSIKHSNTIQIKISTGEKVRDLSRYWYHEEDEIVELEMSPTQFIDAITNMNSSPVPVTLRRVNGKHLQVPPDESIKNLVVNEFNRDLQNLMGKSAGSIKKLNEVLDSKIIKKSDIKEVIADLTKVVQDIESNLPFVQRSFLKQMDRTITEAKGEIEATFTHRIHSLGSAALVESLEQGLISGPKLVDEDNIIEQGE